MKKYKSIERHYSETILESEYCDICKNNIRVNKAYAVNETKVSIREGHHYPQDDFVGTEITFDICPDCFRSKIIPFLEGLGAEAREVEF